MGGLPGRPADLAGADRRRLRRLAGHDPAHRDRVGRLRRLGPAVHRARRRSPTTSRGRCPTSEVFGRGGAAVVAPGVGRGASPARCTTRRGSSWPTATSAQTLHAKRWFDAAGHYSRADVLWPGGADPSAHPLDRDRMTRRIRIGIDTGGTFTDVVAFDEDTGELVTTKTPSTPGNPADGFLAGIDKVLGLLGATGADIDAVSHGTTVATNQLLEGKVDRLGFITNTGYEAMLEIARQSVPDGYGNSYFWVKPDRIVPRDLVKGVEGRLDVNGDEVRPVRRGRRPRGRPLVPRPGHRHPRRLLPARLRQPGARGADARGPRRGAPRRRRVAVQRGAARVPRVRARDDHARRRGREAAALGVRHQHQEPARPPTTTGPSRST